MVISSNIYYVLYIFCALNKLVEVAPSQRISRKKCNPLKQLHCYIRCTRSIIYYGYKSHYINIKARYAMFCRTFPQLLKICSFPLLLNSMILLLSIIQLFKLNSTILCVIYIFHVTLCLFIKAKFRKYDLDGGIFGGILHRPSFAHISRTTIEANVGSTVTFNCRVQNIKYYTVSICYSAFSSHHLYFLSKTIKYKPLAVLYFIKSTLLYTGFLATFR